MDAQRKDGETKYT